MTDPQGTSARERLEALVGEWTMEAGPPGGPRWPGGASMTFAWLEEGTPLTRSERAAMPDADTVWLTPLDEVVALLERAGLAVTWQEDYTAAHRETAQALADAFAADADAIGAQVGRPALDELLAAHRLWVEWLGEGRVRKFALVAERA